MIFIHSKWIFFKHNACSINTCALPVYYLSSGFLSNCLGFLGSCLGGRAPSTKPIGEHLFQTWHGALLLAQHIHRLLHFLHGRRTHLINPLVVTIAEEGARMHENTLGCLECTESTI